MAVQVTKYETKDGKTFNTLAEADAHEKFVSGGKAKIKEEVKDLLNKIAVLTEDKQLDNFTEAVGNYARRVISNEYAATDCEDQFFSSYCY